MHETLNPGGRSYWIIAGTVIVLLPICSSPLAAQAWLPPSGTGYVALSYQYAFVKDHYLADGSTLDVGHIRTHFTFVDIGYSPVDRLTLNVGMPYVLSEYTGRHPHQLPIDGGKFHGAFSDVRVALRYQLLNGQTALTPYAESVFPSHDYEFFAHSAVGRQLHENSIGFFLGRTLDEFIPNTYIQTRLSYTFVEQAIGIKADHSNFDLDLGYFPTTRLSVRVLASNNRTHGGVDFHKLGPITRELYLHHDQILRERHFNVGGGFAYALTDSTDVFFSALRTISGANGHKLDHSVTIGAARRFTGGDLRRLASGRTTPTARTPAPTGFGL